MKQDSFSRTTRIRARLAGLAGICFAVSCALGVQPAAATDASTLQQQASAAAAQAGAAKARADAAARQVSVAQDQADARAQQVAGAASQVQGSQGQVDTANVVLTDSERKLGDAQQKLFDTQQRLQQARDYDAKLGADLAAAQDALTSARQAVTAGQSAVDAQRRLMGSAAREAFQQQTPMEGLASVFGAQTPADLSQRLQWSDTIFDTQSAEHSRLDTALLQLQASRDLQAQIEARVAGDKEAAAAQVQIVADLATQAASEEASVAVLVAQNQQSLLAARQKLAASQATLSSARSAQSSAAQALDDAQGELSATKDAYAQALADSKQLQQDVKAAIARQKAAEAKAADAAAQSAAAAAAAQAAAGASSSSAGVGPHERVSASGFIRPIDAQPGSPFGMRFHPILHVWMMHEGVDFGASCGTPIYAAMSGTVLEARLTSLSGNYTVIGHGTIDGVYVTTGYAHQSQMLVSVGDHVTRGQVIGHVGDTGLSTECHLHFEIRHDGTPVNPMNYIP